MISLSNDFCTPMTEDQVRAACPYAFAETPTNPDVSGKYIQANTATVIKDMEKMGWYPVQARQCRAKKGSKGIRSFHMVAMQNDNVTIPGPDGKTESYVRIIIQNSHDGFSSFKFMMGLYRCVCSNGLVVADAEFTTFSIRHINYSFEELLQVVNQAVAAVPGIRNKVVAMRETMLDEEQKRNLAIETFKIRKGDENAKVDEDTVNDLLTPLRREDAGNSLWNVFNVLQEKMIKGGFSVTGKNGKARKQRSIKSIKKDAEYNQQLWGLAESYVSVAA